MKMDARSEKPVPVENPLAQTSFMVVASNDYWKKSVADFIVDDFHGPIPSTAENNADCLRILQEMQTQGKLPDIVITDLSGPGVRGVELAKQIYENKLANRGTFIMTLDPDNIAPEERNALMREDKPIVAGFLTKGIGFNDEFRAEATRLVRSVDFSRTATP